MRYLTKSQKRFIIANQTKSVDLLMPHLEQLNDYETLYLDVQRFKEDLRVLVFYKALNPNQAILKEKEMIERWR